VSWYEVPTRQRASDLRVSYVEMNRYHIAKYRPIIGLLVLASRGIKVIACSVRGQSRLFDPALRNGRDAARRTDPFISAAYC
jgi:hypothetical protein